MIERDMEPYEHPMWVDQYMRTEAIQDVLRSQPAARGYLAACFARQAPPKQVLEMYRASYADALQELDGNQQS